MIYQNPDENKEKTMERIQNEQSASLNELDSQPFNSKFDITLNKRNRKKLNYKAQEFPSQNLSKQDEEKCDLNQNILEGHGSEYTMISMEQDITHNKRLKKKNSEVNGSESLSEIQAKSNEISFEYNQDGSLYQQSSEVTDSNISKEDEFENIGKVSTSRQTNRSFFFNSSVSQHRILSKQLERMKSKCSLNLQLNKLESKQDSQEDEENEVEEDEDDEEVEYEDEEDDSSKLNYQKIDNDLQQKSWKKRLANDYLILEILGNGGQGKVATFLDKNNNNIIALKEFARIQEFDRESKIYKFLQEHTGLHDYINLMLDEDRSQRQIKMQMGCCNLYEMYIHMKNYNTSFPKNQICWEQDHLIKIFRQLIHGLIAFRRNKFFHGDIKPHNLMLFSVENVFNHYMVKYIDLGAAGFEEKEYYEFYSDQFYHPEYLDMIVMKEYVLSEVEVNICEIFAIIRSIWIIICFEREDVNNFKQYPELDFGIEFIKSKYPRLASLMQKVVDFKGDLDLIEKTINEDQLNESIINPLNSLCLIDPFKIDEYKQKYCHFDITQNYLKLSDQMKELIQNIIQMKKEKFINEQSEDQLQELFEILYSLGQDQRALEIFHKLESSYERQFKVLLGEEKGKLDNKQLSEENVYTKVRVIKESIILLNEKGELDKAIFWNKKLLNLFSSTKWRNNREAILATIQYSILLNTKGDVMSSLQMSKDARNKYKEMVFEQVQQNKETFKIQLQRDSLYGYICQVIGRLYVEINSYSNGLKYLKQALQIFECLKKENLNQNSQTNLNESEIEFEDLNNMIQLTLIKLSQASLFLRHNNKALEYIDAAIQKGKQMYGERLNKQLASCLNIKSHILKQQNQDLQALELQNKCLEIRLKIHNQVDHRFISNSLNSISLLESKIGFHEQALQNQEQCYQMRLRLYQKNNPFHNQIISCLRNFGDYEKSESYFLQALELADKSNDLFSKMNSLKMLEKYYKQVHQIENYKKYQNLRIQTKLQILEVKKNMQIQKEYQNSINQSRRKMSSQTEIVVSSPISQHQQASDEENGNNSAESKKLRKSAQKKQQKGQSNLDSSQLTSQDQIQLTKSYPIEITQSIIINKAIDKKQKNQTKSFAKVKSPTSSNGEIQAEKAPKPRPKYKKKTRNIQLNSIIIEESVQEIKEESNEKAGFSQLLESQPIKDQQLEKQNYKKNDGKRHPKKKNNKSQSEIGEIPIQDDDNNNNNNTISLKNKIQKQYVEDPNDIFKDTQKIAKNRLDNLSEIDIDKNQKSLHTTFQRGKTKSYQEQTPCDDNQKPAYQNQKPTNNNNSNKGTNNLLQSNDKKYNKYKGNKYQKGKNSNLNKSNKDLYQEQEYIEVIQTESKQQPKQESFEEKKC